MGLLLALTAATFAQTETSQPPENKLLIKEETKKEVPEGAKEVKEEVGEGVNRLEENTRETR